jgi:hypothetical protein
VQPVKVMVWGADEVTGPGAAVEVGDGVGLACGVVGVPPAGAGVGVADGPAGAGVGVSVGAAGAVGNAVGRDAGVGVAVGAAGAVGVAAGAGVFVGVGAKKVKIAVAWR